MAGKSTAIYPVSAYHVFITQMLIITTLFLSSVYLTQTFIDGLKKKKKKISLFDQVHFGTLSQSISLFLLLFKLCIGILATLILLVLNVFFFLSDLMLSRSSLFSLRSLLMISLILLSFFFFEDIFFIINKFYRISILLYRLILTSHHIQLIFDFLFWFVTTMSIPKDIGSDTDLEISQTGCWVSLSANFSWDQPT